MAVKEELLEDVQRYYLDKDIDFYKDDKENWYFYVEDQEGRVRKESKDGKHTLEYYGNGKWQIESKL